MKNSKITRDISYGMYVVTTKDAGCIINTLCQITSGDNPIITVSINKENYTNTKIRENKRFNVGIISEQTSPELIATFGFKSSKDINKYESFDVLNANDLPIIKENTIGYISCELIDIVDCETHDIFIAKVIDGDKFNEFIPMTYKYYHEVIKGKAPSKAPTYIEELEPKISENKEEVWVCNVCGYVHKGPLPEDFRCPWCNQSKDSFIRQ